VSSITFVGSEMVRGDILSLFRLLEFMVKLQVVRFLRPFFLHGGAASTRENKETRAMVRREMKDILDRFELGSGAMILWKDSFWGERAVTPWPLPGSTQI
jgi:hypothetical protein